MSRMLLIARCCSLFAVPRMFHSVGPSWLELVFLDITSLGGAMVLSIMTAAVIGFLLVDEKRAAAVPVFASVGGGALLSILLKFKIDTARSDLVPHPAEVHMASFPSGHAMYPRSST